MAAVNMWVRLAPRSAHLVTGPLAAIAHLLVARSSGLSWADLGLGRAALVRRVWYAACSAALIAVGYGVPVAVPPPAGPPGTRATGSAQEPLSGPPS